MSVKNDDVQPEVMTCRDGGEPEAIVAGEYRTVIDMDRRYVYVSDAFCRLVGYTREELIGKRYDALTAPETNDLRTVFNLFCQLEYMHGLWMLVARSGTRILVRYESWVRPDQLIEGRMQLVAAGLVNVPVM